MSKFLYVFDAGHGGIHPTSGEYVTPGKRAPHPLKNGEPFYEGVNNMILVEMLKEAFTKHRLDNTHTRAGWMDTSLKNRVDITNQLAKKRDTILISIHSNGAGNGREWYPASGISCYTSKGQTQSDGYAELWMEEIEKVFGDTVKYRTDRYSDGDADKEANFYVLRRTTCPAILCEIGFHTNEEEVNRMITDEWRQSVVQAFVNWAMKIEGV